MFGGQPWRGEMDARTDHPRIRLHRFLCSLRSFALSGQSREFEQQFEAVEGEWTRCRDSYDSSPQVRVEVADRYFAALEAKLFSLCLCVEYTEPKVTAQSQELISAMLATIRFTSDPGQTCTVQQAMEAWVTALTDQDNVQDIVTQLTEQTRGRGDPESSREKALLHHVRFRLLAMVLENQPEPEIKREMMEAADLAEDFYLMERHLQDHGRRQCQRLLLLARALVTLGLSPEGTKPRRGRPVTQEDEVAAQRLLEKVGGFGQADDLWCRMLEELGWSWLCHYRGDPQQARIHAQEALECANSGGFQTVKTAISAHLFSLSQPPSAQSPPSRLLTTQSPPSRLLTAQSPPSRLLSPTFEAKLEIPSVSAEENFSLSQTDSQKRALSVPDEVISPDLSDCSSTFPKSTVESRRDEVGSTFAVTNQRLLSRFGSETSLRETPPDGRRPRSASGQEAQDYTSSTRPEGIVEPCSNERTSSLRSIQLHREASLQQPLGHAQPAPDSGSWEGPLAGRGDHSVRALRLCPAPAPGPLPPPGGGLSASFVAKLESGNTGENHPRPETDSHDCLFSLPTDSSATSPKSTSSGCSVLVNNERALSHFSSETPKKGTPTQGGSPQNALGRELRDFSSSTPAKMAVESSNNQIVSPPDSILVHRDASLQQPLCFAQTARNDATWDAHGARTQASFPHNTLHPRLAPTADRQTPQDGELSSTFVAKLDIRSHVTEVGSQGRPLSVQGEVSNQEVWDVSATVPTSAVKPTSGQAASTSMASLRSDLQSNTDCKHLVPGRTSGRPTHGISATETISGESVFSYGSSRHPYTGDVAPSRNADKQQLKPAEQRFGYYDGSYGVVCQRDHTSADSGIRHSSTSSMNAFDNAVSAGSDVQDHSLTQCKQAVEQSRDLSNNFSDDSITECKRAFSFPSHEHESSNTTWSGAFLADHSLTHRKLPVGSHPTGGDTGSHSAQFPWHGRGFDEASDHGADQSCTAQKQIVDSSISPTHPPGDGRGHRSGFPHNSLTRSKPRSGSLDSACSSMSSKGSKSGYSIPYPKSFNNF